MAYDELLADRVRSRVAESAPFTEREMFGGIAFMIGGNMAVGVSGPDLMVRVGPDGHDEALSHPEARDFDMSGRPMRGWVLASVDALDDAAVTGWIDRGIEFARSLPPK